MSGDIKAAPSGDFVAFLDQCVHSVRDHVTRQLAAGISQGLSRQEIAVALATTLIRGAALSIVGAGLDVAEFDNSLERQVEKFLAALVASEGTLQ